MRALFALAVLLCASEAAAQVGACGPGLNCQSQSFQPKACVATSALPTCNTSRKGQIRCDTTQGCLVACFGSAWACVATSGGSSSGGGWQTDGGSTSTTPSYLRVEIDGGFWAAGDVSTLGSLRTYDSSNTANNFRISTYNGTTSFEQNGAGAYACNFTLSLCTFIYAVKSSSYVEAATYLRTVGEAHGSLPTCTAGIAGAIEYCTTHARQEVCNGSAWGQVDTAPPILLGTVIGDPTAWNGTNTRGVLGFTGRDFTVTKISSLFGGGTGNGTHQFYMSDLDPATTDGGACTCPVRCDGTGGCPDAGTVCWIACTGQCQFSKNATVYARAGAGTTCGTLQPASVDINIYGTLGSTSN